MTGVVMPLIGEANRNAVAAKRPQFLDKAVIEFFVPFAGQKLNDCLPARKELCSITPHGVLSVSERNSFGVARVPCILCQANFLRCCFCVERWKWRF